MKKNLLYFCFI